LPSCRAGISIFLEKTETKKSHRSRGVLRTVAENRLQASPFAKAAITHSQQLSLASDGFETLFRFKNEKEHLAVTVRSPTSVTQMGYPSF
jgi:hypothetical protein